MQTPGLQLISFSHSRKTFREVTRPDGEKEIEFEPGDAFLGTYSATAPHVFKPDVLAALDGAFPQIKSFRPDQDVLRPGGPPPPR